MFPAGVLVQLRLRFFRLCARSPRWTKDDGDGGYAPPYPDRCKGHPHLREKMEQLRPYWAAYLAARCENLWTFKARMVALLGDQAEGAAYPLPSALRRGSAFNSL